MTTLYYDVLSGFNLRWPAMRIANHFDLPLMDVYTAIGLIGDHEW